MTAAAAPNLDLGVIGNCEVAGLIDTRGRLVWGCLPRLDGDPAFSALLTAAGGDSETGVFAVELQDEVGSERQYLRILGSLAVARSATAPVFAWIR